VSPLQIAPICISWLIAVVLCVRLRQVDVKAEHFERQVQRVEQERDMWEKKYEVRPEHGRSLLLSRFSLRII
jgi:hypothetical protein